MGENKNNKNLNKNSIKLKTILNANKKIHIHFVGIGGVSMYSLAIFLKNLGHKVTGSDAQKSKNTKLLEKEGIWVCYHHTKQNVENCNLVIYSYAVENCVEVKEAQRLNIPCFSRAQLLGQILKLYKMPICVAGAHGKTTTTALIYSILKNAGKNVDLHLGASLVNNPKCNELTAQKNKDIIVAEACEYKDAFLNFKPSIVVVTNIAPEHLDYFKTFDNVKKSFNEFSSSANMLICACPNMLKNKNCISYGLENSNFVAKNLIMQKDGTYKFTCFKNGKFYGKFHLNLIGKHNVLNALASICVADYLKIHKNIIYKSLSTFCGVERRYEILNKEHFIVHDYAHHPDEISAVIEETLKFYKGKLLVVFQPHTYSRTKNLMQQFVACFKKVNDIAIYKTYSAREQYLKSGSAKRLAENIGGTAKYFNSKNQLISFINQKVKNGFGVLILGAGNINQVAKHCVKQ